MNKLSGEVTNVSRDGKRVQVEGSWYSAFSSSQMPSGGVSAGDWVNFTYVQKGEYNNIKGSVTKGTAPASRPTTGAAPSTERKFTDAKGFVIKEFPVPPLHPDRSIIRQNSLAHASDVINAFKYDMHGAPRHETPEEYAKEVIEIARMFEAYSTGDLDAEVAEEEVRKMLATDIDVARIKAVREMYRD